MYFSEKDKNTIDNCRFCFMCRHVCPVARVTGKETNNARSRAALLSLVARGFEYTADMANMVYECTLCGACTTQCATCYDPLPFTRAARLEAVFEDLAPESVKAAIRRILDSGAILASDTNAEKGDAENLTDEIRALPKKAPILLYLGSARRLCPGNAVNAVKVLKRTGLSFMVMDKEPDSGADLADIMGPAEEVREMAQKAADAFNSTGAEKIICLSPDSAKIICREYREWGITLDAKPETFAHAAALWIKEGLLKPAKKALTLTCHDSYHLVRELGESETVREIISSCANLKEMYRHGKEAVCCGEGAVGLYRPDLAEKMARRRIADAQSTGAELIVATCPQSYYWLNKAGGMPVKALETLLAESL
jgi:Fe-S oxidoreductase